MSSPSEPAPPRLALTALLACGLFAAVFAAHAPLLPLGFYADDYGQLREIHADLSAGRWPWLASARATLDERGVIGIAIFRPALEATNAALMLLGGRDEKGRIRPPDALRERIVSIALRALLPVLLFLLLLRLDFGLRPALLGAAFSAANPAPYNAAAWIAARGDLWWVAAALMALLTAIPARGRPPAAWRPTMVVVWVVLGLLAKETGALCGVIAAVGLMVGVRRGAYSQRSAWGAALGIVAVLLGYTALRRSVFGDAVAAYPNIDPSDPLGSVLRLSARALRAAGMRLVGGRGFDPDESAFAIASTFASLAASAAAIGFGLYAAFRSPRLRGASIAAMLVGGISLGPILVQSGLDILASRLLVGWTCALGFVVAAGAARSALGARLGLAAVFASGAAFVAETESSQALCASMDGARAALVRAAAEAGPTATLLVATPPRTVWPDPVVPDWATMRSIHGVFLGLDHDAFLTESIEALSDVADPSAPDRPRTSAPGPLVVAMGEYDPADRILRHRCRVFPALASDLPPTIAGRAELDGALVATLPPGTPARAYPAVTLTIEPGASAAVATNGVAKIVIEIVGGTASWRKVVEAPIASNGPRTLTLWHTAYATEAAAGETLAITARPEIAGEVVVRALEVARMRPTLSAVAPEAGAKWIAGTPPPRFAARDRSGFPFTALILSAKLGDVVVTREFVRGDATAAVGATADGVVEFDGPDGPAALLAAAAAALEDGPLLLHVRYEARARADGPAMAVAGMFDIVLAGR